MRADSPAIGTTPLPCLPVLSATSCSTQSPNDASRAGSSSVSLSRSGSAQRGRHERAQGEARIVADLAESAGRFHRAGSGDQCVEVDTHQRRRHHAEERQRGIASADVGRD